MKNFTGSFGLEAFLIYFVPGALVLLACFLVIFASDGCQWMLPTSMCTDIHAVFDRSLLKEIEFTIFVVSTIVSGVFGCIIAVLAQWVEDEVLDPIATSRIWSEYGDYLSEAPLFANEQHSVLTTIWHWYIVNLQALKNSYISKLVLRLHFTTRIGMAAMFLFVPLVLLQLYVICTVVVFIVFFLLWGAYRTSYALGVFRLLLYLKHNDYPSYQQIVEEKMPIALSNEMHADD
ncbi:MAG: hypothetical protein LJE85_13125 [Gammaproteobacteria bacterium]|jgi:hypothetical protein|nr:hypothetical protein [Gammaproteobacteria bacterium]